MMEGRIEQYTDDWLLDMSELGESNGRRIFEILFPLLGTMGVDDNGVTSLLGQPRWLSGLRRSRVHSLVIARRSLCPEKLGSNPGQGSKGINFSGWHGLDMSITVTKRR